MWPIEWHGPHRWRLSNVGQSDQHDPQPRRQTGGDVLEVKEDAHLRDKPSLLRNVFRQLAGVSRHFEAGDQLDVALKPGHIGNLRAMAPIRWSELPPIPFQPLASLVFVPQTAVHACLAPVGAAGTGDIETGKIMDSGGRGLSGRAACGWSRRRRGDLRARSNDGTSVSAMALARRRMLGRENGGLSSCAAVGRQQEFVIAARHGAIARPAVGAHHPD
jgi:hypothetical protein